MKNTKPVIAGPVLQLSFVMAANLKMCYWCGQILMPCGMCKGSGLFKGSDCQCCNGSRRLCASHYGNWDK